MHSNLPLVPFDSLKTVTAGSVVYPPGGKFGPRVQSDFQLVMLYTGDMNVNIDGHDLHVHPGHVVLLKPDHEEVFMFSKTEETWHRWISVHTAPLDHRILEGLHRLPPCLPLSEAMNRLTDLVLMLHKQAARNDPVLLSLGLAALHLYPVESKKALLNQEKHPAVYMALSWMREHYAEDISLKQIAAACGVSPEHLVRLFGRFEQTTPIHYLWRIRIDRAIALLTNTGLTVAEIAQSCGFKTPHHLARLIKQSTGRTATEIRRMSWGGLRRS